MREASDCRALRCFSVIDASRAGLWRHLDDDGDLHERCDVGMARNAHHHIVGAYIGARLDKEVIRTT
jgi:hypothetical protein